jgi:hypothetical protein
MKSWMSKLSTAVLAAAIAGAPAAAFAHDPREAPHSHAPKPQETARVSAEMASAAMALWNALTPAQQQQVRFDFADAERQNWHAIPRPRKGLPIKDLTPAQRNLAWALITTGMSHTGFSKAQQIISLEQVLKELEAGRAGAPVREPELYFLSLFGAPAASGTWGWRFEGHHLSVNYTIVDGKGITGAPTFLGSNPAEVREGPRKGLRILAAEDDLGRQLVLSLNPSQRRKAVISGEAPGDIVTFGARKVEMDKVAALGPGIRASELSGPQRDLLMRLIEEYARWHRPEIADEELRRIHVAGFEKVSFLWAGGTGLREGRYYRVLGPTFLIEYDNTQNQANHVHSIWRDAANDFGEDLLKQHYDAVPHPRRP